MATKKGKVTLVNVKEFDDGGTSVSFKIGGDERWFRAGKKRYKGILEKGNTVSFEFTGINDTAAKLSGAPELVSGKSAGEGGSSSGGGGSDNRSADIHYQSARKDAVHFLEVLVTAGAVKLPAKESAKLEALEALLDRYVAAFYADIETKGAVARANPKTSKDEDEDPEASEEEEEEEE